MSDSLPSKHVALITGCGKRDGLGAATARRLAADGIQVAVSDLVPSGVPNEPGDHVDDQASIWAGVEALVDEIVRTGGDACCLYGDVRVEEDANKLVENTITHFGKLDILINNAAAPHGEEYGLIQDVPMTAFDAVMRVNVAGTFMVTKAAVPHMLRGGWGRIVNISSVAGKIGYPKSAIYCSSKAAIIGLTRSLAIDLAPHGVTVNAVCPGHMMTSRSISGARQDKVLDVREELRRRAQQIPVGRYADPSELAEMIAFLASENASFVTAQAISVDGAEHPF
jgi:3-oxoacyl-[acyl-carrier protein] reductase